MKAEESDPVELVRQLAPLLVRVIDNDEYESQYFPLFEEWGVHVTRVHFYQPIPDSRTVGPSVWERKRDPVGFDLNTEAQLELVTEIFPKFREEYDAIPHDELPEQGRFYLENGKFGGTDALAYYCMIRHFRPARIIEVGSGFSTLLGVEAAAQNGSTAITAIDPYPTDKVLRLQGLDLDGRPVEELEASFFDQLEANDFLFIDSSHVSRIGGDVNFLFLEVLPRLKPGVLVHVHDIFLPAEYPKDWFEERRFWNEQYLLQAFLTCNREWEVLLANNYLGSSFPEEMKKTFPKYPRWQGGSFWMRRKPD